MNYTTILRRSRDGHPEQAERVVNDPMGRRPVGKEAVAALLRMNISAQTQDYLFEVALNS